MKNQIIKLIAPISLFLFGCFCLYQLHFTNWFDIHKIWILTDFHLYIIFISFIISSIYYIQDVLRYLFWRLDTIYIDSEKSLTDKAKVIEEMVVFFSLEKSQDEYLFIKKMKFGIKQKIYIDINDDEYCIYLELSWLNYTNGSKLLREIEAWLTEKDLE